MKRLEGEIRRGLKRGLPGLDGQLPMSPRPRRGWSPGHTPDDCRDGAGLLLVYPNAGVAHVLLTVRDGNLPNHAGQVSLPGGAVEPGETFDQAALREAHEEVNVDPLAVCVLGGLSTLHVPVSRFVIHPRVGLTRERPEFVPDHREVARVLEVPLGVLRDPGVLGVTERDYRGQPIQVPYFELDGERVWGATAMILSEFLTLLGVAPNPWPP